MKNKIVEVLKKAGLYSAVFRDRVANEAMEMIGDKQIDETKFDAWIFDLNFEGQNVRSYFLGCLRNALQQNLFSVSSSVLPPAASTPQTVEEFEASWEAWKETLRDLQEDFCEEEYPSRGVLSHDKNTNEVRAVSDGKGGLIYIDGTVSGKYPRLEELPPEEQEQLILQVKNLHGSLLGLENVIRRMKEHAEACNY